MCLHMGELGELESYSSSQEKKVMGPGQGFHDGQGIANAVVARRILLGHRSVLGWFDRTIVKNMPVFVRLFGVWRK